MSKVLSAPRKREADPRVITGTDLPGKKRGLDQAVYEPAIKTDSIETNVTTVTTSATKIDLSENNIEQYVITHLNRVSTLWIGQSDVAVGTGTPLEYGDRMVIKIKKGTDNNLYAISDNTTTSLYATGMIRE